MMDRRGAAVDPARRLRGVAILAAFEARRLAKARWFHGGRLLYGGGLLAFAVLVLRPEEGELSPILQDGRIVVLGVLLVQLCVAAMLPPIVVAHALARERAEQTVGLLLASPLRAIEIVGGLAIGRLLAVLALLAGGAPAAALGMLGTGVSTKLVAAGVGGSLLLAIATGAIGALVGVDAPPRVAPLAALLFTLATIVPFSLGASMLWPPAGPVAVALGVLLLVPLLVLSSARRLERREEGTEVPATPALPVAPEEPDVARVWEPEEIRGEIRGDITDLLRWPRGLSPASALAVAGAVLMLSSVASPWRGGWASAIVIVPAGLLLGTLGIAVLLAASFVPAAALSQFQRDPCLPLLAMTERRIEAELARTTSAFLGGVAAWALVPIAVLVWAPHPESGRSTVAGVLVVCVLLSVAALSVGVGAFAGSDVQALGWIVGGWVLALATALMLPSRLARWHPLHAPGAVLSGGMSPLRGLALAIVLGVVGAAALSAAQRRLTTIWREPALLDVHR